MLLYLLGKPQDVFRFKLGLLFSHERFTSACFCDPLKIFTVTWKVLKISQSQDAGGGAKPVALKGDVHFLAHAQTGGEKMVIIKE